MMLAPTAADREQQAARQALQRRIEPLHQAFFEQRNYKSLIKSCEALLKKDPKSVEVRTFLAMAKQQIGEPREALAIMTSLVRVRARQAFVCMFTPRARSRVCVCFAHRRRASRPTLTRRCAI